MLKMYYKNAKESLYDVEFERISDTQVRLSGDFPVKSEGFYLSRANEEDDWDYSKFTKAEEIENGVVFSIPD